MLGQIAEHKINRIDELLPWKWATETDLTTAARPCNDHTKHPKAGTGRLRGTRIKPAEKGRYELRFTRITEDTTSPRIRDDSYVMPALSGRHREVV